ncbi:MAG: zinc-dependent alcohol dehydrogenase [Promethearchaeota archaeon]
MIKTNNESKMNALVFEAKIGKLIRAYLRGKWNRVAYWKKGGPVSIKWVQIPKLISEDWVIVKTVYCGICGSDMKELSLNGALDNPLRTLISFPQVLGHEPVGIIDQIGENVSQLRKGDKVAIDPWFPCKPRGIHPKCLRCKSGDFTHCQNFQKGLLPSGMHLGTTKGFGGFAPYIAVHESQCYIIPDKITFEQAVLADPFSVAFHSLLILDPAQDSTILVYGLGVIGLLTVMILKKILSVKQVIAIGRYKFQKELALKLGATHVFTSPSRSLIEEVANYLGFELFSPDTGLNWTIDGVDGIIDTIASAETLEIGMRIIKTRGRLVFLGVSKPKRCESTLHYFKELEIIGSNGFSIENYEGKKAHAFEFFLEFLERERINTSILITHKYPIEKYQEAFNSLARKSQSHAIKAVFNFT